MPPAAGPVDVARPRECPGPVRPPLVEQAVAAADRRGLVVCPSSVGRQRGGIHGDGRSRGDRGARGDGRSRGDGGSSRDGRARPAAGDRRGCRQLAPPRHRGGVDGRTATRAAVVPRPEQRVAQRHDDGAEQVEDDDHPHEPPVPAGEVGVRGQQRHREQQGEQRDHADGHLRHELQQRGRVAAVDDEQQVHVQQGEPCDEHDPEPLPEVLADEPDPVAAVRVGRHDPDLEEAGHEQVHRHDDARERERAGPPRGHVGVVPGQQREDDDHDHRQQELHRDPAEVPEEHRDDAHQSGRDHGADDRPEDHRADPGPAWVDRPGRVVRDRHAALRRVRVPEP